MSLEFKSPLFYLLGPFDTWIPCATTMEIYQTLFKWSGCQPTVLHNQLNRTVSPNPNSNPSIQNTEEDQFPSNELYEEIFGKPPVVTASYSPRILYPHQMEPPPPPPSYAEAVPRYKPQPRLPLYLRAPRSTANQPSQEHLFIPNDEFDRLGPENLPLPNYEPLPAIEVHIPDIEEWSDIESLEGEPVEGNIDLTPVWPPTTDAGTFINVRQKPRNERIHLAIAFFRKQNVDIKTPRRERSKEMRRAVRKIYNVSWDEVASVYVPPTEAECSSTEAECSSTEAECSSTEAACSPTIPEERQNEEIQSESKTYAEVASNPTNNPAPASVPAPRIALPKKSPRNVQCPKGTRR